MCKQASVKPDPHRIPIAFEDLPYEVSMAIQLRKKLRSTYGSAGMSGCFYTGKDYTTLPLLFELYEIDQKYMLPIFEIIHELEEDEMAASVEAIKKQAGNKGSGSTKIPVL